MNNLFQNSFKINSGPQRILNVFTTSPNVLDVQMFGLCVVSSVGLQHRHVDRIRLYNFSLVFPVMNHEKPGEKLMK